MTFLMLALILSRILVFQEESLKGKEAAFLLEHLR